MTWEVMVAMMSLGHGERSSSTKEFTMRLAALIVVFTAFTGWSFTVLASQGLAGLVNALSWSSWPSQLFVDLTLALSVAWAWLWRDAARRGIRAWPYLLATVVAGSIGVLAYLIHREVVGYSAVKREGGLEHAA